MWSTSAIPPADALRIPLLQTCKDGTLSATEFNSTPFIASVMQEYFLKLVCLLYVGVVGGGGDECGSAVTTYPHGHVGGGLWGRDGVLLCHIAGPSYWHAIVCTGMCPGCVQALS